MKLNLGARDQRLPGYMSVDITGRVDVHHDLAVRPWPFEAGAADEIVASHILEHLDQPAGRDFLAECYRVLAPGGQLHVAVPDMDKFIRCQLKGDWAEVNHYKWNDLNHLLGGDETEHEIPQRHRYMYCFASLAWELQAAGFCSIRRRQAPAAFDNPQHAALSLYVDATR